MNKEAICKLEAFFAKYKNLKYKKGEILIRADDSPSGVFLLKDGRVKECVISNKGKELTVNIYHPSSFFPMSWAINNTPNNYYFEAISNVEVWRAPKDDVVKFIKKEKEILYALLCKVFEGTDGLLSRMTYLMGGNAYARLIAEILIHAKKIRSKDLSASYEQDKFIELIISEKELAAQTGMTRETISREMKRLKEKNLVVFDKNILRINSFKKLADELGLF